MEIKKACSVETDEIYAICMFLKLRNAYGNLKSM